MNQLWDAFFCKLFFQGKKVRMEITVLKKD